MTQRETSGVAWIAGVGAKAGLGAALARRFARDGYTVAVTARTAERLAAVVDDIRKAGGQAHALAADVSREEDVSALRGRLEQLGPLHATVFNAALAHWAPTLELSVAQFEETWRVSTLGGFLVARTALSLLAPQGRGSLIFTGATASLRGKPPFAAFASAKAGLRSLAQALAREFGPKGIHVAQRGDRRRHRRRAPAHAQPPTRDRRR
ncbi:MAG TPA: SDR family NAD(P)-dependent oxidoreductase [Polyangiales bacterium]